MVEVKGKFITLTAKLMEPYDDARDEADQQLFAAVGKHWNELDAEAWYDIRLCNNFAKAYADASQMGDEALITLGKGMYPTIKRTSGLPSSLKAPADYLRHETEVYLSSVRGWGVAPRRIVELEEGHAIIEAKIRAWNCKILEGVYLGILEMAGATGGAVEQRKCVKRGDEICEFHITWQPAGPVRPDEAPGI